MLCEPSPRGQSIVPRLHLPCQKLKEGCSALQPQIGECLDKGRRRQAASAPAPVHESRSNTRRRPTLGFCIAWSWVGAQQSIQERRLFWSAFQYRQHQTGAVPVLRHASLKPSKADEEGGSATDKQAMTSTRFCQLR
ncbi:hypothetical protein M3J09_008163 [Ascochyta lentis]